MKNIAVMVPCLYRGGAERVAGLLSKHLSKSYNVFLFIADVSNIVYDYGGTLIDISVNGKELMEATIKEYKNTYGIDCSISFLEPMNFMNIRTKGKECVIISERCAIGEMEPYQYGDTTKIKKWYNYADKIVSVAYGVEYDLKNNLGIRGDLLTTIYNFIDKDKIIEKANALPDSEIMSFVGSSKVILNVGRMEPQKNQKRLLIQFAKLIKQGYDVKLLIIGKGELKSQLLFLIEELKISNYVRLMEYSANPFPYYKMASVMAVSSDYEGLPNVILESFLLGLPVVAADCLSGPRELLKDSVDYSVRTCGFEICQKGILVEKSESETEGITGYFADAMKYLLDNEEISKKIVSAGYDFMDRYTNEKLEKEWIEIIENTPVSDKPIPGIDIQPLKKYNNVIVYGAGEYGRKAMKPLLPYKDCFNLLCFAAEKKSGNPDSIWGVPVYMIDELLQYRNDSVVIIGVSYEWEHEVTELLGKLGFHYIYSEF